MERLEECLLNLPARYFSAEEHGADVIPSNFPMFLACLTEGLSLRLARVSWLHFIYTVRFLKASRYALSVKGEFCEETGEPR